jgi:polysaccharide export outer membrane protein
MMAMMLGVMLVQEPVKTVAEETPATQPGARPDSARKADESKPAGTAVAPTPGGTAIAGGDGGYRIGPEDVLQIDVWKETDFSAATPVRPDGKISVPLLNDVQAAGLTPIELAESLREKLSKYVIDPRITVIVTQTNSRKAYVMGMVNRQGTVRLLSNLTVLQAISASGGLAQFAKSKQIYVLRDDAGQQRRLPFNYDAVIKGKHPEQNILLQPGDTVVVP